MRSQRVTVLHVLDRQRTRRVGEHREPAHRAGRVDSLFIAGHLRLGDELPGAPEPGQDHRDEDDKEWQMIEEFRRLPADRQSEVVDHILSKEAS